MKYKGLHEKISKIDNFNISITKITDRELIKDKIKCSINEYRVIIDNLGIDENLDEAEKINILLNYILSDLFFNKEDRENNFKDLLNNEKSSIDDKNSFLDKDSDQTISSNDWKQLIYNSGITKWSTGKIGNNIKDRIDFIKKISYYSLQATLRTGIHTGLFLQNIGKYFPHLSKDLFNEFDNNFELAGGLALTEKTSGSDLLKDFTTSYIKNSDGTYTIKGEKHLQGLTNEASHWIILAKNKKRYRLFLVDTRDDNQNVYMSEEYNMAGLKSITYGVNDFEITVPEDNVSKVFDKDPTGLKTFVSMLYDSRLQFPSMMVGSMQRLYDESYYKASLTNISGGKMIDNEIIKDQLKEIKIRYNIVDLINKYLIFINLDLTKDNTEISDLSIVAKTISTEYILKSALVAKDLQGGLGFKESNIITSIYNDAWPFSRFEGVNEMLYSQLSPPFSKNELIIPKEIKDFFNIVHIDELNNSIKGQIYSRIYLISIINELGLEKENKNEIDFLKNEIRIFLK